MTATIATLERVREAYRELMERGATPSAANVLKLVHGSKSTVLRHLATVRAEATVASPPDAGSAHLRGLADQLVKRLWTAAQGEAVHVAEQQLRSLLAHHAGVTADLAAIRLEWEHAVARAEAAEQRIRELERASSAEAHMETQIQSLVRMVEAMGGGPDVVTGRAVAATKPEVPAVLAVLNILCDRREPMERDEVVRTAVGKGYAAEAVRKAFWHADRQQYLTVLPLKRLKITDKGMAKIGRLESEARAHLL